ncbi:unnamed protein product, partial [Prunus brigantina]
SSAAKKKRVAFLLIDGVGDVSIPKFVLKTPLQAVKVPNLDAIASAGVNGLMDHVEVGLGCPKLLGVQGPHAAGPLHAGQAPSTFPSGFPIRAWRTKKQG